MRTIIGVILAPLVMPVLNLIYLLAIKHSGMVAVSVTVGFILPLSYATMILAGLPTLYILRKTHLNSLSVYLALGLLLGLVGDMLMDWAFGNNPFGGWLSYLHLGAQPLLHQLFIEASQVWIFGIVATLSFWLIVRPDQTQTP